MGQLDSQPRWLNSKQAAAYCGYESYNHFRELTREYKVPRHGPNENRFDRLELDEWMQNPQIFIVAAQRGYTSRRRPGEFRPV
jgi:hypothetical protein